MSTLKGYDTYWENSDGREILLSINYYFYPATTGGRNEYGVPMEPDEDAVVEIVNIRTSLGQDPQLACLDWDREYAVQVITAHILADLTEGEGE